MTSKLKKRVMRRVYAYVAYRLATHNLTKAGVVSLIFTLLLAQLVFVEAVVNNLLEVGLADLPRHVLAVATSIDGLTLAALLGTLISFAWAGRLVASLMGEGKTHSRFAA